MDKYYEINDFNKNLSIALGFFDGIHIGHRAVLNSAISYARLNNLKSAVITFENHPRCFLNNLEPEYILTKQEKIKIFESLGFDFVYFLKFDDDFSKISAQQYLNILLKNFEPKAISTGFNHTFGKNREGTSVFLEQNAEIFGYKYFRVNSIEIDSEVVSSSKIRENLKFGNIEQVNKMLGRNYFLEETVVEGEKIGRVLGFKTANLIYPKNVLNIAKGVYCAGVEYCGKKFKGVANFGMRPSFENTQIPVLEVHILDFDKDIYGEKIKVEFIRKIRDEKKFESLEELKTQIKNDISMVL